MITPPTVPHCSIDAALNRPNVLRAPTPGTDTHVRDASVGAKTTDTQETDARPPARMESK